ncbi:MAG: hypothetical protein CBC48_10395 [bacterium TMED88]|nr:XshC-Cox1-family protein [Deltaproteobacteria bacterium]OUV30637.1 MAG: hypothetical protein CBC48_10395 [bacterium TMED88]
MVMREVLKKIDQWIEAGEEVALATLIDTHGSSPRPAGARFCCTRTGQMVGSVSSGCIEGDVFERALEVMRDEQPTIQRYGIEAADGIAVGLSCGGEVDVLIEPFKSDEAWQAVVKAVSDRQAIAHCVALEPNDLQGRHMAFDESGQRYGSIHPGIDASIVEQTVKLLEDGGQSQIEEMSGAEPFRVFVQALAPPPRLLVIGATHTAMPLVEMASTLGFETFVIDPRSPFAHRDRFPTVDHLLLEWPDQALSSLTLDRRCHILTLSHDLKFDIPALACALRSPVRYIGALGSRRTHAGRLDRLRELGFDDVDLVRIHTPVGLDLGARTPEEIALAILAEIVAVRHERTGQSLRDSPAMNPRAHSNTRIGNQTGG